MLDPLDSKEGALKEFEQFDRECQDLEVRLNKRATPQLKDAWYSASSRRKFWAMVLKNKFGYDLDAPAANAESSHSNPA